MRTLYLSPTTMNIFLALRAMPGTILPSTDIDSSLPSSFRVPKVNCGVSPSDFACLPSTLAALVLWVRNTEFSIFLPKHNPKDSSRLRAIAICCLISFAADPSRGMGQLPELKNYLKPVL